MAQSRAPNGVSRIDGLQDGPNLIFREDFHQVLLSLRDPEVFQQVRLGISFAFEPVAKGTQRSHPGLDGVGRKLALLRGREGMVLVEHGLILLVDDEGSHRMDIEVAQ
mgnify:CR=1 FL=1